MLATEDRTIEEALEYFDSNKYIDYVEIVHDYPYREINDDSELIDLINSYDLKYTIHAPFIDINIASLNPAVADFSVREIERSIDLANMIDSNLVVVHPGILGFHGRGKEELVYKISEEHLEVIGNYAKDCGVDACIENLPNITDFMFMDVNQLNDTLVKLDLPMTMDIGHAHTNGFTDDDTHLALGDGTFDVNGFFDVFTKKKYDGIYMLELMSVDFIEKSLEYMKNLGLI